MKTKSPKPRRISLQLTQTAHEKHLGQMALGDILEQAANTLCPSAAKYGMEKSEIQRLVRIAVRGVAEAVLRDGELTMPIRVNIRPFRHFRQ